MCQGCDWPILSRTSSFSPELGLYLSMPISPPALFDPSECALHAEEHVKINDSGTEAFVETARIIGFKPLENIWYDDAGSNHEFVNTRPMAASSQPTPCPCQPKYVVFASKLVSLFGFTCGYRASDCRESCPTSASRRCLLCSPNSDCQRFACGIAP